MRARRSSAAARGGSRSRAPGPMPTMARRPRGGRRAMATGAWGVVRLGTMRVARLALPELLVLAELLMLAELLGLVELLMGAAARRAAASATLGVPTAEWTTALGFGTGTSARSAAEKKASGQPCSRTAASRPGSSCLRSTVAAGWTDRGARPAEARAWPMRAAISSEGTLWLAPRPMTRDGGR